MARPDRLLSSLRRIVAEGVRARLRGWPPAGRGAAAERRVGLGTPRDREEPARSGAGSAPSPARPARPSGGNRAGTPVGTYPGDFSGMPDVSYRPSPGSTPDPGEVVWTRVPFEEDHTRGKDRPVLLVGRDGAWLLGVPLTSKDHDRDEHQEAAEGRFWADVGSGAWDRSGRPSEARVNRVVRVDATRVRRVGGIVPEDRFQAVVAQMRRHLGGVDVIDESDDSHP